MDYYLLPQRKTCDGFIILHQLKRNFPCYLKLKADSYDLCKKKLTIDGNGKVLFGKHTVYVTRRKTLCH